MHLKSGLFSSWRIAAGLALAAAGARGDPPAPPPPPMPPLPAEQLDQLLAPIALYPDPLLAIVLPAASFPSDLTAAAACLAGGGDPNLVQDQPWDPSVKSLAHFPSVVEWMAQNLSWTETVGAAFASDPSGVMDSIQRLRAQAMTAGTLTDNSELQVIVLDGQIEIEPAQPDEISVPFYDPGMVYAAEAGFGYDEPFFTFGPPCPVGPWLTYAFFWQTRVVAVVDWGYWRGPRGWWRPREVAGSAQPWRFPSNRPAPRLPPTIRPALQAGGPMPSPQPASGVFSPQPGEYRQASGFKPASGAPQYQRPLTDTPPQRGPTGAYDRGRTPDAESKGSPPPSRTPPAQSSSSRTAPPAQDSDDKQPPGK